MGIDAKASAQAKQLDAGAKISAAFACASHSGRLCYPSIKGGCSVYTPTMVTEHTALLVSSSFLISSHALTLSRLEVNPALSLTRSPSSSHQSFLITSARAEVAAPQVPLPRLKSRRSSPNRRPLSECKHLQLLNQTSLLAVRLSTFRPSLPGSAHARTTSFAAVTGTTTPSSRACLLAMVSPALTMSSCFHPRALWTLRSAKA